jgi:hypothetical protein
LAISGISRSRKEILGTWQRLPHNLLGVPVFALLIWLHTPLWRYFRDWSPRFPLMRIATSSPLRSFMVSLGYLLMFRDRVRLFPVDFELGGVLVPDPARGENAAGSRDAADYRRMTGRLLCSAGSTR